MERERRSDERAAERDALARESADTVASGDESELDLLLSEDGEARRRFLKQALIAGGGSTGLELGPVPSFDK